MITERELTIWNGESGGYNYQSDQNLMKDKEGNIWYSLDGKLKIWCSSERLTSHLKRLLQVQSR